MFLQDHSPIQFSASIHRPIYLIGVPVPVEVTNDDGTIAMQTLFPSIITEDASLTFEIPPDNQDAPFDREWAFRLIPESDDEDRVEKALAASLPFDSIVYGLCIESQVKSLQPAIPFIDIISGSLRVEFCDLEMNGYPSVIRTRPTASLALIGTDVVNSPRTPSKPKRTDCYFDIRGDAFIYYTDANRGESDVDVIALVGGQGTVSFIGNEVSFFLLTFCNYLSCLCT